MKINSKFKIQDSKIILNFKFLIFNSRSEGLTLIEVLVALSVLAIGLLGVALLQVTSIGGGMFSREMATATQLSQDMLEKLRTLSYTETAPPDTALNEGAHPTTADVGRDLDGDGKPPFLAVGEGSQNIIDERGLGKDDDGRGPLIYTRTWTVADNTPAQNMKRITITVSWVEKGEGPVETRTRYVTITGVKVAE